MLRRLFLIVLTLLLFLAAALVAALFVFRHPTPAHFQPATTSDPIRFGRDAAAHFQARNEWWYYTGFLNGEDQQRYSFELVFFKAYLPRDVQIGNVLPLKWVSNPLYFAHFAVSDLSAEEHTFFEKANFPKFWSAGARVDRFDVHNGDWRAWGDLGEQHLRAAGGQYRLRLDLTTSEPPVLHGAGGSGVIDMGQAGTSYYYSEPDMRGAGLLYVDGVRQVVDATVWMDHQWGSWPIHGGYKGWDWFSLRLDDDNQIMLFNFRNEAGSLQPESGGTWIYPDGRSEHLASADYRVEVLERWTSPDTGATYPVKWQVTIPAHDVDATVAATFPQQEMAIQLGPIYWEGSVTVEGTVSGNGFVEMTGYAP